MPTDILISSDPWENRVAILEDGSLSEIYIEREEKVIGSIYKGKVQNVLPGMGASFIDIGIGRNAFLYVDDINKTPLNIGDVEITQARSGWTISEKVNRGDEVLVQIVKEPRGLKGARVSTNISLPGRYLILMPTGNFSGVSRKIESAEERTRLKNVMKRIRPEEMATIVRTAAAGVSDAELIADLGVLIRMWHGILENYKSSACPSLVHKDMNLVFKAARDFITPEINRVLVDTHEEHEKLRDFMRLLGPQYVDRISYYPQGKALFKDFKVDEEIARLMRPKVNLPSGGSLVIETTEALTVIDINSGKYAGGKTQEDTILHTNLEAAAEIARQVRLRDIGGIIVCDFIDMDRETNRTKVLNVLETGLRRDRTRTTIQSFSALGLLEFTRKRVGKDLAGQLRASCPTCRGLGNVLSPETVTIETFRAVEQHHHHGPQAAPISIVTSPTVGAQIRYWHEEELLQLSKKTDRPIKLVIDPARHPERTLVTATPSHVPVIPRMALKVGDELELEILPMRMPNPSSGVAILGGRLIEVENAAGAVGSFLGVRVIDVDDENDEVLAEPRGPLAVADRKRRHRKRGRPLSAEDQVEELRELAEEAARIAASAASVALQAHTPQAMPIPVPTAVSTPPPTAKPFTAAPAINPMPQRRPQQPSQRFVRKADVPATAAAAPVAPALLAASVEPEEFFDPIPFYEEQRQARGPRRPMPGRRPQLEISDGIHITPRVAEALERDAQPDDDGNEDGSDALFADAVPFEDGRPRRRRRRRRGRGRGGVANPLVEGTSQAPESGAVPNRSIFRVATNGTTEQTGMVAPNEPSRAISPWRPRAAPIAIEAPPPSLSPQESGPPLAQPARRRGRPPKNPMPAPQLTSAPRAALPNPEPRNRPIMQQQTLPLGTPPSSAPPYQARPMPARPQYSAAPPVTAEALSPSESSLTPPARRRGRPPRISTPPTVEPVAILVTKPTPLPPRPFKAAPPLSAAPPMVSAAKPVAPPPKPVASVQKLVAPGPKLIAPVPKLVAAVPKLVAAASRSVTAAPKLVPAVAKPVALLPKPVAAAATPGAAAPRKRGRPPKNPTTTPSPPAVPVKTKAAVVKPAATRTRKLVEKVDPKPVARRKKPS